ncbi:uncharacterized protein LOC129587666 [Paramacrobiotus metropolitanus]|uniref:uncharacterized protein LOC129587666 n=1 Tax=Paramacrobiotus metropolitanus TaxID=2943436 RepID=UPI002445FD00|nr:uncharacterized protein LOC129587666 [Paramacrobiotus metropolitanus]
MRIFEWSIESIRRTALTGVMLIVIPFRPGLSFDTGSLQSLLASNIYTASNPDMSAPAAVVNSDATRAQSWSLNNGVPSSLASMLSAIPEFAKPGHRAPSSGANERHETYETLSVDINGPREATHQIKIVESIIDTPHYQRLNQMHISKPIPSSKYRQQLRRADPTAAPNVVPQRHGITAFNQTKQRIHAENQIAVTTTTPQPQRVQNLNGNGVERSPGSVDVVATTAHTPQLELGTNLNTKDAGKKPQSGTTVLNNVTSSPAFTSTVPNATGHDPQHHDRDAQAVLSGLQKLISLANSSQPLDMINFNLTSVQNDHTVIMEETKVRQIFRDLLGITI